MFLLPWNLIHVDTNVKYIQQVVCDTDWQSMSFSENFSLETGIGLRPLFPYKVKLLSLFSIRFYSIRLSLVILVF